MDLELSDEEAALRDNVRTVLDGICPPAVVRKVYEGGALPRELWAQMVDLGWPALAIDEAHGGLGLGVVELALVAEELGRVVAPSPFLATTTQFAATLGELGGPVADDLLAAVATQGRTGTVAVAEAGSWSPARIRATAEATADGWVLSGVKSAVIGGAEADHVLVIARGAAGLGAFVVDGLSPGVVPRTLLDPTLPFCDLRLDGLTVSASAVVAEPGSPHVDRALTRAIEVSTVSVAAMTVGACRRIFEMTVDYAKAREQYGRPIGSFQALKHRMVDMYLSVERATALVYFAALTIAEDVPDRSIAAAAAKAAAGDCQALVVEEGLQLHGGIGYTWEHDLHFLMKRAKTGEALFGGAVAHRAALAHLLGVTAVVA